MLTRNNTIDIAKGIGIILVVLGHTPIDFPAKRELFRIIYSFHIPLFFFLSGIFLKDSENLKRFTLSKADALLKPYFVVLTLVGVVKILLSSVSPSEYFFGMVYATSSTIWWVPLWFLPHLFVALLLGWLILVATRNFKRKTFWRIVIAFVVLAAGTILIRISQQINPSNWIWLPTIRGDRENFPGFPFSIDIVGISLAFILFGFITRQFTLSMRFNPAIFLSALGIFSLLHYKFDEIIDLNARVYGNSAISTLEAFLGIYLVLSISACIANFKYLTRLFAYIGSSTLFILIFHWYVQGKSYSFLSRLNNREYFNGILAFFIGLILPIILLEITKRQPLLATILLPRRSNPSSQRTASGDR